MNKPLIACFAALALHAPGAVMAATEAQKQAAAEKWKQMTPEEQAAAKAKAKTKWDAMSPEEQEAAKKKFADKHPQAAKRAEAKQAASAPTK